MKSSLEEVLSWLESGESKIEVVFSEIALRNIYKNNFADKNNSINKFGNYLFQSGYSEENVNICYKHGSLN